MKSLNILLFLIQVPFVYAQNSELADLQNQKDKILSQIVVLNDSVKNIDVKINALKSHDLQKMASDSALKSAVRKGARLMQTAHPHGRLIATLKENQIVVILDYSDLFYEVCTDSICGYLSEYWISENDEINNFIRVKKQEKLDLERLEEEQKQKNSEEQILALDKKYLKKYGSETFKKLKDGFYWIGMTKEMAIISLGYPEDINRTVGTWGIHEQWVYRKRYLYFENGKLVSYQN